MEYSITSFILSQNASLLDTRFLASPTGLNYCSICLARILTTASVSYTIQSTILLYCCNTHSTPKVHRYRHIQLPYVLL
jgi:hypothetical protein